MGEHKLKEQHGPECLTCVRGPAAEIHGPEHACFVWHRGNQTDEQIASRTAFASLGPQKALAIVPNDYWAKVVRRLFRRSK